MRPTLFTIGFTGKSAKEFFPTLRNAGVRKVIDVRLNNVSQLAGFTKKKDIAYFLAELGQIAYEHETVLAPEKQMLSAYQNKDISWDQYAELYLNLLHRRDASKQFSSDRLVASCLLCSEDHPGKCHRRLAAEYLKRELDLNDVEVIHLGFRGSK